MIDPENPSYILIPGAGGMAWYWHRVVALLEQAQREAIAVDLPGDDESAGLDDYAEIVVREIGQRTNVTLVAQSLGAFTAAVACERISVGKLIFVNAMVPVPGETAGDWWGNTGATRARIVAAERGGYGTEFDRQTYFLHDLPEGVLRSGPAHQRDEAENRFQTALQLSPLAANTNACHRFGGRSVFPIGISKTHCSFTLENRCTRRTPTSRRSDQRERTSLPGRWRW
jgi:pimeloyl-ACP methyl ester carboxylesterase